MKKTKKKKKNSAGLFLVLLVLLLALVALLGLKFFTNQDSPAPEVEPAAPIETTSVPDPVEPTPAAVTAAPVAEAAPTPTPMQPAEAPVILENQGDLEIIIPDDMDSEGF